tara:strand:+ start:107 stop:277 length:171 start_codon:yes stop_codon:yes gene_type:complete
MGGPRRNWGDGKNIDHNGSQDNFPDEYVSDLEATEEELEQLIEALDDIGGYFSGES